MVTEKWTDHFSEIKHKPVKPVELKIVNQLLKITNSVSKSKTTDLHKIWSHKKHIIVLCRKAKYFIYLISYIFIMSCC